ncbi:hypothetical protein ABG768_016715, partial [Culter alburnus]
GSFIRSSQASSVHKRLEVRAHSRTNSSGSDWSAIWKREGCLSHCLEHGHNIGQFCSHSSGEKIMLSFYGRTFVACPEITSHK